MATVTGQPEEPVVWTTSEALPCYAPVEELML